MSVDDSLHSVLVFMRLDDEGNELLCAFNFTPVNHDAYRVRIPHPMTLTEAMSNVDTREVTVLSDRDEEGDYVDVTLYSYEASYYYVSPLVLDDPED